MIDNIKYFIFGALAIAAAIAITENKAKAVSDQNFFTFSKIAYPNF